MAVLLSPIFNLPQFNVLDADGKVVPASGYKIFAYEAGSFSTLQDTYTTDAGDVANANPIVLNSAGQLDGVAIWLTAGLAYNLVLTKPDGTTIVKSFDGVTGVPVLSGGGGGSTAIWVEVPGATYLAPDQFLVPSNANVEFSVGNRVRITQDTGFRYGVVTARTFSSPNTSVTVELDSGTLNSSVEKAEYSVLVVNGRTVDAGAVSYFEELAYSTTKTVGNKIKTLQADLEAEDAAIEARRKRGVQLWSTGGTGTAYTLTPSPAVTTYGEDRVWTVRFTQPSGSNPTLNINGVGAKELKQFVSSGALVDADITDNLISQVVYYPNLDVFVVLDPTPTAITTAPIGQQVFTSNGTFTVPDGCTAVKVTAVGGGGGGGRANACGGGELGTTKPGGKGGAGAASYKYLAVSGGDSFAVSVGAGGTGGGPAGAATAGGTSSFGVTLVTAGGGSPGPIGNCFGDTANGADGNTGTAFKVNGGANAWGQYGQGGAGGTSPFAAAANGTPGFVLVEYS